MYHTEKFFIMHEKNSEISKLEVIKLFDQIFVFFNWNQVKWHFLIVNRLFGYKHFTFEPIWQIEFFPFYGIPPNEFLPQKWGQSEFVIGLIIKNISVPEILAMIWALKCVCIWNYHA